MDLNEIFIFCHVAQTGSFTAASKSLSVPKSTVSRKVQDLENRLGVTLLKRTTRKLHLTDAGLQLFQTSRIALNDLKAATQMVTASQTEPKGRIRITAATDVGNVVLAKVLPEFIKTHPKIGLDLVLADRRVDLVGEGFDLALRIGQIRDTSFVARRVGLIASHVYGAPALIKSLGPLRSPEDVEPHLRFRFTVVSPDEYLTLRGPAHQVVRLRPHDALSVDSFMVIRELAVQGQGLAILPAFICRDELKKRKLQIVLESWAGRASPVQLLYPKQRFANPAVTAVRDFLLARLPPFFPD